jgi:hypothetical protein
MAVSAEPKTQATPAAAKLVPLNDTDPYGDEPSVAQGALDTSSRFLIGKHLECVSGGRPTENCRVSAASELCIATCGANVRGSCRRHGERICSNATGLRIRMPARYP